MPTLANANDNDNKCQCQWTPTPMNNKGWDNKQQSTGGDKQRVEMAMQGWWGVAVWHPTTALTTNVRWQGHFCFCFSHFYFILVQLTACHHCEHLLAGCNIISLYKDFTDYSTKRPVWDWSELLGVQQLDWHESVVPGLVQLPQIKHAVVVAGDQGPKTGLNQTFKHYSLDHSQNYLRKALKAVRSCHNWHLNK